MNLTLPHLPDRTESPRKNGVTMVMDKGLGIKQAEQFIDASSDYVDIVKLGFGTSVFSKNLAAKVKIYKEAGFRVYLGGTLFEAFIVRNMFDDYIKFVNKLNIDHVEVSDGSIEMKHDVKCEYIRKLSKEFTVLSEVGSKEEGIIIHPNMWITMMQKELEAGSWKVIAEARESGTVGIYRKNGQAHSLLINKIISKVNPENILWEAPLKAQQVYFIKLFGANVNLGNIGYEDVIPLETLRCGLRGDTFFTFLPKKLQK
ncbi:MAG: phosphosulfolactate synthase [Bacteroidetes bacterium]|nr:phosphosulfolactate synthase [Bacteroidota bacterium]PHX82388.1 MAG: phosphosulfolactate synthase [Flavobacteriales bacterium]